MTDHTAPAETTRSDTLRSRGLLFPKHPRITRGKLRGALRDGTYEAREADAVRRVVRDGDTVLELGGGIGFMSTWIATQHAVAHVHVFEANPHLVPYIAEVHRRNGITNATVHHALLGPAEGRAPFHLRRNLLASSLMAEPSAGVTETVEVPVRDVTATMRRLRPTVLVCDIEGAEAELIPAMDLSGLRAAVIETHPQWIGPQGMNAVFSAFMAAGLAYYARGSMNKVVSFRRDWPLR